MNNQQNNRGTQNTQQQPMESGRPGYKDFSKSGAGTGHQPSQTDIDSEETSKLDKNNQKLPGQNPDAKQNNA